MLLAIFSHVDFIIFINGSIANFFKQTPSIIKTILVNNNCILPAVVAPKTNCFET